MEESWPNGFCRKPANFFAVFSTSTFDQEEDRGNGQANALAASMQSIT